MTTRVHVKILKPVRDTKHGLDVSPGEHILSSIGFGRLRQAAPDAFVVVGVEPDGKPLVKAPTLDDVKGTMPKRTEPPLDGIELAAMDLAARAIVAAEQARIDALADGASENDADDRACAAYDAFRASAVAKASEASPAVDAGDEGVLPAPAPPIAPAVVVGGAAEKLEAP